MLSKRFSIRVAINAITSKSGTRVYLWELASALAQTDGVDLILLVGTESPSDVPPFLASKVRKVGVSSRRSYWQSFRQKQIQEVLLREGIDLYHIPNTMPLFSRKLPTVVTIHDLVELRMKKYGLLRTAYRYIANLIAAHLSDHVITVSQNSKHDIAQLLRIPESKLTVVHNGVSDRFHPLDRKTCKDYLASRYSITGEFILAPGGLSKNKNIPRLLAAMRLLEETGRPESLVILGDKEDREFRYIDAAIRHSKLEKSVIFPGFVPNEELPTFYNAAALVVYPTLYEGFGFPILEAMACGTPVVASNSSCIPEIAGRAALLFNPTSPGDIADSVELVLTNDALRANLSTLGRERARQFTWEKAARETARVFRDVIAQEQSRKEPRDAARAIGLRDR